LEFICKKAASRIVVHGKANRNEQAVARELSKVLSIVIVFVAKNNRLRGRKRKRRQKLEESQKMEEKINKKESAKKTKEPAGKSIMDKLYPNKSQKEDLNKWFGTAR
jgi:phage regulator Rha-like protein